MQQRIKITIEHTEKGTGNTNKREILVENYKGIVIVTLALFVLLGVFGFFLWGNVTF